MDAVISETAKLSQTKDKDELLSLYNTTSQHHFPRREQDIAAAIPENFNPDQYDYSMVKWKFVFVGNTDTGKTSLLERFVNNKFSLSYEPTVSLQCFVQLSICSLIDYD